MISSSKASKQCRMWHIVLTPFRILGKARNLYTNSMMKCAGMARYGNSVSGPIAYQSPLLPKSFSVNSSRPSEMECSSRYLSHRMGAIGAGMRTYSVGIGKIGRIDEERPCSFREDDAELYLRSRSHAVSRNVVFK